MNKGLIYVLGIGAGMLVGTKCRYDYDRDVVNGYTCQKDNIAFLKKQLPADVFENVKNKVECPLFDFKCSSIMEPFTWKNVTDTVIKRPAGKTAVEAALEHVAPIVR